MAYGDAKRRIFFYRLLELESQTPVDRRAICNGIASLSDEDVYYDDDGMITRAEVHDGHAPQSIRFFKVRRDDLPGVDDGHGDHGDLDLEDEEGLAEAIHIRLFPNGVVAAESFGHGPRAGRFALYVRNKLDIPCTMRTIIRHDVVNEALQFSDIRLVKIKLDPSEASQVAAAADSLHGVMATAESLNTGVYAELALRSERGDSSFTSRVKTLLTNVFNGSESVASAFDKLEIEGKPDSESPVASLDLLSERLYRSVEIPYRAQRTRELDADAAFSAIREAYNSVKDKLADDAEG